MCGIAGMISRRPDADVRRGVAALAGALAHRGPDASGVELFDHLGHRLEESAGDAPVVALGHRRLAILDVACGAQPMPNEDATVWVAFNGEIYNYRELRDQLVAKGHRFRTSSDTEVLVHGWEEWGEGVLRVLNGIFAFALFDARTRRVWLARDPIGAKPLYVGAAKDRTWWSSELDAARRAGMADGAIELDAIKLFLALRYIPSPWTPYHNVWKIPPSHAAVISVEDAGKPPRFHRYDPAVRSTADPRGRGEWRDALADELTAAVRRQLMSDVPVGTLLSGGVDSSVVTTVMNRELPTPPQAFAIGFRGGQVVNETAAASLAAREIGVPLKAVELDPADYFASWPEAARHLGEPIANSGILLVGRLCAEVRKTHKVVLTGQGADEPLGGYPRHAIERLVRLGRRAPRLSAKVVQRLFGGDAGERLRRSIAAHDFTERAAAIFAVVPPMAVDGVVRGAGTPTMELFRSAVARWEHELDPEDTTGALLRLDMRLSLPDDLLTVADHFSMQQSVELRVPFLDLQFLELVARMPTAYKISRLGRRKWLYRDAARTLLPVATARRLSGARAAFGRKVGFATPLEAWFARGTSGADRARGWLAEHLDLSPPGVSAAFPSPRQRLGLHALTLWLDGR